jgi:hypothetical protein
MTDFRDTLPSPRDEGPSLLTAFAAVVTAFARLMEAERDLGGYTGQDPAVVSWIRDAEMARNDVLDAISDVFDHEVGEDDTAPVLQGMAFYILTALLTETPSEALALGRWSETARAADYLPEEAPVRAEALVDRAIDLLRAFMSLETDGWPEAGGPLAA